MQLKIFNFYSWFLVQLRFEYLQNRFERYP